jgi:Holliday junction resolvasome RuvABC endonuclease subunit
VTVIGLDLSLTATGIAINDVATTHRTAKLTGTRRLREIRDNIILTCIEQQPRLVVIEGPSYGSKGGHEHERGGLWWMVAEALDFRSVPYAVVAPAALKKYATGKGDANKSAMIVATCRRFPGFAEDDNAADALWLAAMGSDWLGEPMVTMPAVNRAALEKVAWPEQVAA